MPKSVPEITSGPKPVGPYSIATEANGFVFVSGQVGLDPTTGDRMDASVGAEAEQIMSNIGAILGDVGLGYGDIVKTTIFLTDMGDFGEVNAAYKSFFERETAPPARSTVAVAALPLGFRVEIEIVAAR